MIPKKLDFIDMVNTEAMCFLLEEKINEILDYLQAKEEVNKCKCGKESLGVREYCPTHNNPEASKGECTCGTNAYCYKHFDKGCVKVKECDCQCHRCIRTLQPHPEEICPECNPPEHEERKEDEKEILDIIGRQAGDTLTYGEACDRVMEIIERGYVSKQKIKKELSEAHDISGFDARFTIDEIAKSLGIGD